MLVSPLTLLFNLDTSRGGGEPYQFSDLAPRSVGLVLKSRRIYGYLKNKFLFFMIICQKTPEGNSALNNRGVLRGGGVVLCAPSRSTPSDHSYIFILYILYLLGLFLLICAVGIAKYFFLDWIIPYH